MLRFGCGIRAKTPGTDPRTGTSRLFATATVFRVLTDNVVRAKKKALAVVDHKVNGEENPSDACTKHLTGERLRKLVARVGQCQRSGRAQESLRVQPARTARQIRLDASSIRARGSVSTSRPPARVSHLVVIW